jgi:hypothetical protein
MPMSRRQRALTTAGLIGCLAVMAAPAAAASAAAGNVTLAVAPAGRTLPGYEIEIRNGGSIPVDATVRQELPPGLSPIAISNGGQMTTSASRTGGTELSWRLRVPPGAASTVSATMNNPPSPAVAAPACAFTGIGLVPDDCATAVWSAPKVDDRPAAPWWQSATIIEGAAAALLVAVAVGLAFRARRRRRRNARLAANEVLAYSESNVYPKPRDPAPRTPTPRRRPPLWAIVAAGLALLIGASVTALWTATSRVTAMNANRQPSSGAWVGSASSGPIGEPLREAAFEFTVYRMNCPAGAPQCVATVGLRNISERGQQWYAALQRAYLPSGDWVTTDENATRLANGGRDLFAETIPPGDRYVVPLVFAVSGQQPTQIELRSAVFSAGVRVNLT